MRTRSAAKALLATIEGLSAHRKDAFTVKLNSGNADFPFLFTDYSSECHSQQRDGTIDWQSGVGTGGFAFDHA
jgi:peptide/nickel transport system substrate-binding protein